MSQLFGNGFLRSSFRLLFMFWLMAVLTRLGLTTFSWLHLSESPLELIYAWATGFPFDMAAGLTMTSVWILILAWVNPRWFLEKKGKLLLGVLLGIFVHLLLFLAVSEFIFWEEFQARLNFIAIDYLTYTHEVIHNIWESYPMVWIVIGLWILTALFLRPFWPYFCADLSMESTLRFRLRVVVGWILVASFLMSLLENRMTHRFQNPYYQELARNGLFSMGAAWWDQGISYAQFYPMISREEAFATMKKELLTSNSRFLSAEPDNLWRRVENGGPEKRWNVVQITVESLSASYLGVFGNDQQLTPYMDRLSRESLFFTNLYATGSRTIRGMESLSLSIPPTPGQSILRRKDNENLFSLGALFKRRGYDNAFIYGGNGFFDNMNAFFSGNGFRIHDISSAEQSSITFKNAWGACDGDVFNWALKEGDEAYAKGQPFFHFIMTTSNHRPFTYPEGKIDIPQKTYESGVKYTDVAIGEFLEQAKLKPWFKETIFVIVADHCARSSGKTSIPLREYHIPLMIWQPALIPPQQIDKRCSQMDVAPTVAGLLNWSYDTLFFGKDILKMKPEEERAFPATYQKVGYYRGDKITILQPVRQALEFQVKEPEMSFTPIKEPSRQREREAISYYQTCSELTTQGLYRAQ